MWHRFPVCLPSLHLEICNQLEKYYLNKRGGEARTSEQFQSVESNITELYYCMALSKLILSAKIIVLASVVCNKLSDGTSTVVPENLCLSFRCCSDCFLSKPLKGTAQVDSYKTAA